MVRLIEFGKRRPPLVSDTARLAGCESLSCAELPMADGMKPKVQKKQENRDRPGNKADQDRKGTSGSCAGLPVMDQTFCAFFANSPDVMLVIDVMTGKVLDANPATTTVLRYDADKIVGRHFSTLYPEGLDLSVDGTLDNTRVYGPVFEAQPVYGADGRTVPMDLTATLIPWRDGTAMLAVFRDVTDREAAHQALTESEQRYRTLFEKATDAIFLQNDKELVVDANKAATDLLGFTRDELFTKKVSDLLIPAGDLSTPGSWSSVGVLSPAHGPGQALPGGTAWQPWEAPLPFSGAGTGFAPTTSDGPVEMLAQHRSGNTIPVEVSVVPFYVRGEALFLCVVRDITDRKRAEAATLRAKEQLEQRVLERTQELQHKNEQLRREMAAREKVENELRSSEERFRALFEAAEDWIFLKDRNLRFTHVNPSMLRMLGLTEEDVVGKTNTELFGPAGARNFTAAEKRVLAGQTVELEHSIEWKDRTVACQCLMVPLKNHRGETEGLYAIARDITERREQKRGAEGALLPADADYYRSPVMRGVMGHVLLAAATDSIVLLLGESGVGKDYLARFLHDHSTRSGGPFFTINCAALTPDLAESELFGHEAGAFTGSVRRKRGLLELAEGGTLLLNEVGELSPDIQAKLLTFLDTQSFTRVGGQKHISVNARLVAATNRDLEKEVTEGRFRKDLFYRLSVIVIKIPPLAERREDIPLLVDIMSAVVAKGLGLRAVPEFDAAAIDALVAYDWPGNIRELRNVLERAMIHSHKGRISTAELGMERTPKGGPVSSGISYTLSLPEGTSMPEALRDAKGFLLAEALRLSGGSVKEAAQILGITRDSFNHHMRSLGLSRD